MGTFHQGRGELHGITVVVETASGEVFIGRCDTATEESIVLKGADMCREGEEGLTREEYVQRAARMGYRPKLEEVEVPAGQVTRIRRLGEIGRS